MRIQRGRKGWTQRQLAARLATLDFVVHPTTIGKWEGGERRISLDEALAISIALDVALAHMIAGSYSELAVRRPTIALSRKTPAVSARQLRLCIRGQQPLWGQDERRYFSEVAPDEWFALQRPGVAGLLLAVQDLLDACADDDAEAGVEIIEVISDELGRQQRAFERELREKGRRPVVRGAVTASVASNDDLRRARIAALKRWR
jgi:transcriptional regulator with XRE-family HTH domain